MVTTPPGLDSRRRVCDDCPPFPTDPRGDRAPRPPRDRATMNPLRSHRLAALALLVAVCTIGSPGVQSTGAQSFGDLLVADGSTISQGVVLRRDAGGTVTTWFRGLSGYFPNWITMAGDNERVTVALADSTQFITGAHTLVTPAGVVSTVQFYSSSLGFPNGQARDGDGSTYSAHQSGLLTRYDPLLQSFGTVGIAGPALNAIAIDRERARVLGVVFPSSTPFPGSIVRYSPANGSMTTLLSQSTLISQPTGIAVDPKSGDLVVARLDAPGLLRFDPIRRTLQTLNTMAGLNGLVVSTRNTFLVPAGPSVIEFATDGTVLNTFAFPGKAISSVLEYGSRRIAPSGTGLPGTVHTIAVTAPATDANRSYYLGASLGVRPPIATFGGEPLNLAADTLLALSIGGGLPGVFQRFAGVLDASGHATAAIAIPASLPAGLDLPIHVGGIVADPAAPNGVSTVLTSSTFAIR